MGTDNVVVHRYVIGELSRAGIDQHQLIRELALPDWALASNNAYVSSQFLTRLWEVAEHELGDADIAIKVAQRFRLSRLGLYDYLFTCSPTLAEGLAAATRYITSVSTNHHCSVVTDEAGDLSFSLDMIHGAGRGRDHTQLMGLAGALTRCRLVLDAPLEPLRVALRRPAPRKMDAYADVFGSAAIEFDAPFDAITFRAADARRRLITSDPALARVLRPLADALPPPPPLPTTWVDQVAAALSQSLDAGEVSLQIVAQRMMTSPRTLQRRLGEAGTTWRHELDRARAARLAEQGELTRDRQAQILAYADPGSIWRATRRWSSARSGCSLGQQSSPGFGSR
ncbi:AraC family transcriptional regulator [Nocardia sp. NPDC059180]|uniref:AraC family transcriptional regulator n=1 Tax=Nocardia sp. NPDC059180 TaxID=3346761 RepID=UPI00369C31D8